MSRRCRGDKVWQRWWTESQTARLLVQVKGRTLVSLSFGRTGQIHHTSELAWEQFTNLNSSLDPFKGKKEIIPPHPRQFYSEGPSHIRWCMTIFHFYSYPASVWVAVKAAWSCACEAERRGSSMRPGVIVNGGKRGWLGLRGQEWSNSLAERKRSVLPALTGNICMEMLFTGHRWQPCENY